MTLGQAQDRQSYLLEDFLLLDRGESLWEEREDVSLEYERSERSDLSERGDDDRPLLLLLRVGLADPLWRRFLSTGGDKYLSDRKLNKSHVLCSTLQNTGPILQRANWLSHLSFLVGVSSFSLSFFKSFNRASAFSFSFFSLSFSRSSFSFSFSYSKAT